MKIAFAQLNPIVGDLKGNLQKILEAAEQARSAGAQLLVTPELSICGYPPKDLLLRGGFVDACEKALAECARATTDQFGIIVGHPGRHPRHPDRLANSGSLLFQGEVLATVSKTLLPNYDVFDEKRYFLAADQLKPVAFLGKRLGLHLCEDAWWGAGEATENSSHFQFADPITRLAEEGVDLFINLSASPYEEGKASFRHSLIGQHASTHQRPFLFVNQVGGNDDLVFDGNSFAMNERGELIQALPAFVEGLGFIETESLPPPIDYATPRREQELLDAITLGVRDYVTKCGFKDCVLGLSGGIDSALAACIAAKAVGPEHVHGILMPSKYSSQHSIDDAKLLADNLGIDWSIVPISSVHETFGALPEIATDLESEPLGLADQNLQARIRGAIVMTRSNRHGWLGLTTGNKSEIAVGYCTLYGDMCGGFAVLSDLYKQDVYALSRYINESAGREVIPENTINKVPSAELAPDQKDQDTLPPYDVLDAILKGLIDEERSPLELAKEFDTQTVAWVVQRLDRNEFKRGQMAPGVKLSQRAFGTGRRMPMAARGFPQSFE